jgi:hypothetical protein
MPVNVKVINTKDFIKVTATGVVDFAASKQAILDIVSQIKQPGEYEVLVDVRAAEVMLSIAELYELGVALADHPSLRRNKIALLGPGPMRDRDAYNARFFESVAANRGVSIRAFTGFERAITWLVTREAP